MQRCSAEANLYRQSDGVWAPAAPGRRGKFRRWRDQLRRWADAAAADGSQDRAVGAVAAVLHDPRDPDRITYSLRDLVAQRLYGLCCGYEDLNDHDRLRADPLLQTAVGSGEELASSPTFSRMETRATRADVVALNGVLVDQFVASHARAPRELVLDVDASDVPLHGDQEGAQFHGYYDH